VDLFGTISSLYQQAAARGQPLTINGMHLTDTGDRLIAEVICREVFGADVSALARQKGAAVEKLRQAVNDKSEEWHSRYRTVDGNNVYGSRAALAYRPEKGGLITEWNPPQPYVTNFKVMQEEMSQRDVMTANRDKRIWALAK